MNIKIDTKCDNVAYSGKYIEHNNTTYMLTPEEQLGSCMGCSFKGSKECPIEICKFCGQGYILKKVNI